MATKNTILGTVPKSRGRYTEGDTTTKWYYDNILEYKGSSFRCISEESTGITGAPATYNSGIHTLVPNTGWEFFVDTTGALDVEERLAENEEKLSELETEVIYDVTANNNGMTFASLSALLLSDNLSTLIPVSVRCGGMSIRFIQSSDNKYVQYFLTKNTWSASELDWEKLNLEEEISQLEQELGVSVLGVNEEYVGTGGYKDFDIKVFSGVKYLVKNTTGYAANFYSSTGLVTNIPANWTDWTERIFSQEQAESIIILNIYGNGSVFIKCDSELSELSNTVNELSDTVAGLSIDIKQDTKKEKSGSGYQTFVHQLKKYNHYKIELISPSSDTSILLYGLTNASVPDMTHPLFRIKSGESIVYIPTETYEALYYGISSSVTLSISDMDGTNETSWEHIFYCGATHQYTKLIDAIVAAEQHMNSVLYVDDGVYDLISEFGSTYFENISAGSYLPGISLSNGIKIIFSANSRVVCNYTGSNQYVKQLFSPFNAGQGGFELQNLNLVCSNVRYAIHDERNGSPIQSWSIYKNCWIEIDNSNNDAWQSTCCIGGGLGSNTAVVVENCYFKAIREGADVTTGIYYHNTNGSILDASSYVVVKDNYCKNCRIVISDGRTDLTRKTIYNVCGNKANSIYVEYPNNTNAIINIWNNDLQNN